MKNKKWLRPIAFILMLTIAVLGVLQCYGFPQDDYYTNHFTAFDNEGKNLVDGVLIGTSVVAFSWLTPVAWKDYGLAAYHLSINIQPFGVIPEYLDYAQKKQDIKYAVVDVHGLRKETIFNSLLTTNFRSAYLRLPDLISRYKILGSLFDFAEEVYAFYGEPENKDDVVDSKKLSYYLPFVDFHGRWVEGLNKYDFTTVKNEYLGAVNLAAVFRISDCSNQTAKWEFGEVQEIDDFQKSQLQKLVDYANKHEIKLLFVNTPSFRTLEEQQEMRDIIAYCKNQGYDAIDFTSDEVVEGTGLDLSTDFFDEGHLNAFGAKKITDYICEYLIANDYYTPDHRGDKKYSEWDKAAEAYSAFYEKGRAYMQNKLGVELA